MQQHTPSRFWCDYRGTCGDLVCCLREKGGNLVKFLRRNGRNLVCLLDSWERKSPWGHVGVLLLMTVQMCATVSYGLIMYQVLLLPSSLHLVIFQMSSFQPKHGLGAKNEISESTLISSTFKVGKNKVLFVNLYGCQLDCSPAPTCQLAKQISNSTWGCNVYYWVCKFLVVVVGGVPIID